jgi:hypothetical protein
VSADGADFGVTVELKALASHADQFTGGGSNTIVRTHFAGPAAKKAGGRECGEIDHLLRVCGGEWNDVNTGFRKMPSGRLSIRLKMHVGVAAPGWQDCMHNFLRCCRQILSLRFQQAK